MTYALLGIIQEVLGRENELYSALYHDLRYHREMVPFTDPPRWLTDRFAAACDDLRVWAGPDRERMRESFFAK